MLVSRFRKEYVEGTTIYRPRFKVHVATNKATAVSYGLIDSGADRTIIPEPLARFLGMPKGQVVYTAGIGGQAEVYESIIDIIFIDETNKTEKIAQVPVYVIPNFRDIVIGRNKIFDEFRVTFEQVNNKIVLEKISF